MVSVVWQQGSWRIVVDCDGAEFTSAQPEIGEFGGADLL